LRRRAPFLVRLLRAFLIVCVVLVVMGVVGGLLALRFGPDLVLRSLDFEPEGSVDAFFRDLPAVDGAPEMTPDALMGDPLTSQSVAAVPDAALLLGMANDPIGVADAPSATVTSTPTTSPTPTPTTSPTPTPTTSPTPTPTETGTPTLTPAPERTSSAVPLRTTSTRIPPTDTATASPTPTATLTPTPSATASPTPSATPAPTFTPTASFQRIQTPPELHISAPGYIDVRVPSERTYADSLVFAQNAAGKVVAAVVFREDALRGLCDTWLNGCRSTLYRIDSVDFRPGGVILYGSLTVGTLAQQVGVAMILDEVSSGYRFRLAGLVYNGVVYAVPETGSIAEITRDLLQRGNTALRLLTLEAADIDLRLRQVVLDDESLSLVWE